MTLKALHNGGRDTESTKTDLEPAVYFGVGKLCLLPTILAKRRIRRVLLVSGKCAYAASGAEKCLCSFASQFEVTRFSEFTTNPTLAEVNMAARIINKMRSEAVVAIGGGTAMDIAKAAALLAAQESSVEDHLNTRCPVRKRDCLLILVPTTAGSGSEMTSFCAIYVEGTKKSLDDPLLQADYVIVDPNLTATLPAKIAASAGLDALCLAIESLWSVRSTPESRGIAAEALRLVVKHIEKFCSERSLVDRLAMARAAHLAGKAINLTRTTAPHAVSYALTTMFGIPHGHSCALTLPAFLRYNAAVQSSDLADPRGLGWVQQRVRDILELLDASDPEAGRLRLIKLVENVGLESSLSALGLGPATIERILDYGFDAERAGNNPRRLSTAGLREVLLLSF
jgi:alcohol dehydrogenase class IV